MVRAKIYILNNHFSGKPKPLDLKQVEEELPPLKDGEFLAQAVYLSVDPYMRALARQLTVGSVFFGSQVAKIVESKSSKYPVGKHVVGQFGWRTYTISDGSPGEMGFPAPRIIPDLEGYPLSLALGVLGMTGCAAYFGLLEICKPRPGETVVVSSAAGAVGSHVGQIARLKGCKVVGITGDDKKGQWLVDILGFHRFINYKKPDLTASVNEAVPEGIDCYFDNVGGELSSIVISKMNDFGRIAVCGSIVNYSYDIHDFPKSTNIQYYVNIHQLKMEGFRCHRWLNRWDEAIQQNLQWLKDKELKYKETVTDNFENMLKAFVDMLDGKNMGKSIVKV